MEPLHQPLRLRIPRLADIHPGGQRAAEALALDGQLDPAAAPPPDGAFPVPHQQLRHRAQRLDLGPPPGEQVLRAPRGTSSAQAHREYPHTIVSTGSCFAVRTCPNPAGTTASGNQKSHCASSPAAYLVRDAGSAGKYAGRSSATRPLSVRIEYGHPIRSAITVAGMSGTARSSSRIRDSNPSATDPAGARSYRGGPADRTAARTVFRETFIIRAICLTGSPSARCNRRISAQSSTEITCFLPGPARARLPGRRVKIRMPRRGQYSPAVDTDRRFCAAVGCLCRAVDGTQNVQFRREGQPLTARRNRGPAPQAE